MEEHLVAIPPWQFWLLLVLAGITVVRFAWLMVLRYLRSQSLRTRQRLDEKLAHGLSPYTLKSREQWKDLLRDDQVVKQVMDDYEQQSGKTAEVVREQVEEYLEEIVPSFNVLIYFRIGYWLARAFLRSLYTIQVGHVETEAYDKIGQNTCVLVASNHRSNFDPLIHIYMASRRSSISFSAGEWSRGWPFRHLLHAIGFYIVRRDSGDPLYRKILERYIFKSVEHCIPLGLFLEGGLTRDGTLQKLKLGTLNYAIKALGQGECEDIVVIPSAISYDKVPEDKTLVEHQEAGFRNKGKFYSLISFLRFVASTGFKLFQRNYKAFGYACVNYGEPISVAEWQQQQGIDINALSAEERRQAITRLGELFEERIIGLVPIPPTSILAEIILRQPEQTVSALALKTEAYEMIRNLRKQDSDRVLSGVDDDFALDQGLSILVKHRVIEPTPEGGYQILPGQNKLLEYYAGPYRQQDIIYRG